MGRQLEIGQSIPEGTDSVGNRWYLDDNAVFLKLIKDSKPKLIGYLLDDTLTIHRSREKHLMRKNNSYGINEGLIEALNINTVILFEDDKVYKFSSTDLKVYGEYLHFKEQGFELQIFMPLNVIETFEIDYLTDPKFYTRFNRLGESWFHLTKQEFEKPYMIRLGRFIADRRKKSVVYPEADEIFKAFKLTPYENVKVVIIGQDPYYNEGVADGLAFSCKIPSFIPKSLDKIYDTLEEEYGILNLERNPNLEGWAEQGVLLLNRTLTVEKNNPNSHKDIGWKIFTDFVFNRLREHPENLVFLLWGSSARNVRKVVDNGRHLILEAEHPAFAARDGRDWENNNCFVKCNSFLRSLNKQEINWT